MPPLFVRSLAHVFVLNNYISELNELLSFFLVACNNNLCLWRRLLLVLFPF